MKTFTLITAIVGTASVTLAQGVTSAIAPSASAPAGCSASYDGNFEITVAKVSGAQKRDAPPVVKRDSCATDGILVANLASGTLKDAQSRTGYIASNFQFQFDGPAQAGAIYTSGFSACSNGSLALGGSAVFYECASGDFYNLYDRSWAAQCSPVEIIILPCGGDDSASEAGDGQVVGTQIITTTIVSALGDGQPQVKTATTGIPLCQVSQISDGQVQVGTTPCASITTTAQATSTLAPVSQYSDGQIQVTPAASVPTVTSVPAVTETQPASAPGTTAAGSATGSGSGSIVTLPTNTQPGASSAATSKASGTTGTGAASGTTSAASSGTSAPAQSGAAKGTSNMLGAMAALFAGLVGAVAFL